LKELRLAAEGAIEELQQQLSDTQEKMNSISRGSLQTMVDSSVANTSKANLLQAEKLEEANSRLNDENMLLHDEIQNFRNQCKQWKDKLSKAERATREEAKARHDAEVAMEIVKRTSILNSNNDNRTSSEKKHSSAIEIMHDKVQDLQVAVQSEREQYKDLLEEHETLLAVLAQQDLERATLCTALARSAGRDAVKQAVEDAQQSAIQKFGEYIQVSS